jgi:hypothetical protein
MNRKTRITYFEAIGFLIFVLYFSGCCLKTNGSSQQALEGSSLVPVDEVSLPLIKKDIDLTKIVLTPKDLAGLFPPTYSISQKKEDAEFKGILVTYQTESIPHTLAFAKGFSTQIEIYKTARAATVSFGKAASNQAETTILMGKIGEESLASRGEISTPEGFVVPGEKYSLLFRHRNAIVSITIKIKQTLPPQRLEALGTLILDRLKSTSR